MRQAGLEYLIDRPVFLAQNAQFSEAITDGRAFRGLESR